MCKRKWLIALSVLVLLLPLSGCGNRSTGLAQLPEGHPTEAAAQPVNKEEQTAIEQKIIDLLNKKYPGEWKITGTKLSKGSYTENGSYKIVDDLEKQFPETMGVSIFVGEERISSSVKRGTERVLNGYPAPAAVGEVFKSGLTTSTLSSGYLNVYLPLKAKDKKTIAVLTLSMPQT